MLKLKIKITAQKINFYFYLLAVVIILTALSLVTSFLYKNFYQAITQSEEVLILRERVIVETVDIKKFDDVIEKIRQKIVSRQLGDVSNPFD